MKGPGIGGRKSRLLRKAPKAPKLRKKGGPGGVGSFRAKLDWHWLCACVVARGVELADVEDVAQDALVVAARLEPGMSPRPGQTPRQARRALLRGILRYEVLRYFYDRRKSGAEPREDIERIATTDPITVEEIVEKARREALEAALADLEKAEPDWHAMLQAHDLEEESVMRIAARMRIPVGTAATWLRQARLELRALLQRHAARRARKKPVPA